VEKFAQIAESCHRLLKKIHTINVALGIWLNDEKKNINFCASTAYKLQLVEINSNERVAMKTFQFV